MSRPQADRCPVEPHAGQFMDNLLDPRELGKTLKALVCEGETVAYSAVAGRGGIVKFASDVLN